MTGAPDVVDLANAWLAEDPDPDTRAELETVLDAARAGDSAALADLGQRFSGRLEFGTAGLRGPLGAGPMRMNVGVVRRAAAGLATYLRQHVDGTPRVVVGFDARHKSDLFARETVRVFVGAGLEAYVLPRPVPTPVTAYAIRRLGAHGAVVVTASHNPPQDNGYKVYVGPSQIVAPIDAEISAAIDEVGPLASIPLADDGWQVVDESLIEAYLERAVAGLAADWPRSLAIVYTPLHGVGGSLVTEALAAAGFADVTPVAVQAEPDPDFSTVAFPNPEEPGALDAAYSTARDVHADVILANDPDADRCAVAIPDPSTSSGWRMLRGDEVGALLAVHLIDRHPQLNGTVATTIVSSSLLAAVAARHGLPYAETLTGFKWLTRVPDLAFAYEEALGYCCDPDAVADKDGVSALLLVAELAATARSAGATLGDRLDDIARSYGLYATDQVSVRMDDVAAIDRIVRWLGDEPPRSLGGLDVESVDDLGAGVDGLPPTPGIRLRLADRARVVVRPSGTEPKLKAYLEVVIPPEGVVDDTAAARAAAGRQLAAIAADLDRAFRSR